MLRIISDKTELQKYVSDIVRLEKICFDDPWSENIIRESLCNDLYSFFLSVNNDGNCEIISGYCCVSNICGECEIQRICVDNTFRRSGIGYSLLEYVINNIPTETFLLEVRDNNIPAVSLYRKAHFEPYYLRKDYYGPGEDALLMRRKAGAYE